MQYSDFKQIPGFSKYIINRNGIIINLVTKNELHPTLVQGYYVVPLMDDYGRKRFRGVARLLCTTFKPTDNMDNLHVDHKNCIKTDNRLDNLEWVTPKENTVRAAKNGLMGKKYPIIVRNYYTKEEVEFESIQAAAIALNMSVPAIEYRVNSNDGRVFPEGYQYKKVDSDTSLTDKEDADIEIALYGNCKRVYLRNVETGEVIEYDSLSNLANALNMPLPTLSTYISKSETKQPIIPGLFQLKFYNDKRDWIDYDDPWIELQKVTGRPLVQVTNATTGETKIFISQADCAREMGCSITALNNRLRIRGTDSVYKDGNRYGYYPF